MPKTMRAAVLDSPGRIIVTEVACPEPGAGEVRIRLEGCGVCGSNLGPWEGRPWFQYPFEPGKPGHEGWGEIEALGPGVSKFQCGDRVAPLSYHAFAEFDTAPEDSVIRLPETLQGKPFPGEALGCAMNVFRRSRIQPGETVAVIGIGFLGAVLTALSARAGARVAAISRRSLALEIARSYGAAHTIPMEDHWRILDEVKQWTGGEGCDCVIEAVGLQWPLDLASEMARERGRLIIAGYHQDGPRKVNMQLWNWRGLDVINAHERDSRIYCLGMEEAAETVARGGLDPTPLYTHQFSLDQIADAFNAMKDRPDRFMKALVRL